MAARTKKRIARREPKRKMLLPVYIDRVANEDWDVTLLNALVVAAFRIVAAAPADRRLTSRYVGELGRLCNAALQFSLNVLDNDGRLVRLPDAPLPPSN